MTTRAPHCPEIRSGETDLDLDFVGQDLAAATFLARHPAAPQGVKALLFAIVMDEAIALIVHSQSVEAMPAAENPRQ